MRYLTSSIRTKIIFPYILLTLIVGAVGAFAATRLVFDTIEERLDNQLVGARRVADETIVDQEGKRLAVLRQVSNTKGLAEALQSRNYPEVEEIVTPIANNNARIDSIVVLDDQGKEVFKLDRAPGNTALQPPQLASGADYIDWPGTKQILSDQPDSFGDKHSVLAQSETKAEDILYSVGPIRLEGKVIGLVLVGSYLNHVLEDIKLKSLADVTFYEANGQVRQTTFSQVGAPEVLAITSEFYDQIIKMKEVLKSSLSLLGQEYALTFAPFQLRNKILGAYSVGLNTNFIFTSTNVNRTIFIVVIFIAISILFFIGLVVTQQIIRPLARLVSTSRAIAAGKLDLETGITSTDEIGRLAKTFDQMTVQLRARTEELQELVKWQSAILSSIADGVLAQDRYGQITQINPAAQKILSQLAEVFVGYQADEHALMAKKILARLERTTADQQNDYDDLMIKERVSAAQAQILTADSGQVPARSFDIGNRTISTRAAPVVTDAQEMLGAVVVLRDITLEVEAEKLKNTLISGVSHELLTPVTALKGYLQLFQMISNSKLNERQSGYLNSIDESVNDLHHLISTLIDFVEIEHDEGGFEFEEFNLDELIEEVGESNQEKMEQADLTFTVHILASPLEVKADENRIRRILNDLLDNAANYNHPGGAVEVYVAQKDDYARIDIVDTGRGISEAIQPSIIRQPFIRDVGGDDKIRGNGLSLYLAGKIIPAHKGKIWFKSEVHKGSTFSFTIPLINDAAALNGEEAEEKYH